MQKGFIFGIALALGLLALLASYGLFVLENGSPNSGSTKILYYSPIQCGGNPWEIWYTNGGIFFIKAPTEQELVHAYYSNVYNVQILSFETKKVSDIVCLACSCPRGDIIIVSTSSSDAQKMLSLGWKEYSGWNTP